MGRGGGGWLIDYFMAGVEVGGGGQYQYGIYGT